MPSTKKVAPKLESPQKKAVVKTSKPLKTKATSKTVPVKTVKSKAVTKLTFQDKTAAKKVVESKATLTTKKEGARKKVIKNAEKQTETNAFASLPAFLSKAKNTKQAGALALLSPYRLPIDAQGLAVATARYGGVFFVAVGAFFTLWFAQLSFGSPASMALLATYTDQPILITDCTLTTGCTSTSTQTTTTNTQPAVDIIVNNPDELEGSVQVKVKVPNATSVYVRAFYKTQNQDITLGSAKKVSSDTWEMYWDTNQYDDGEYKLKAVVQNQYGTYETFDNEYVTVVNALSGEETLLETATQTVTTTGELEETLEEVETIVLDDPYVSVYGDDYSSEFNMEVEVEDADKVKVYVQKKSSTSRTLLGYAYESDTDVWKYRWVTTNVDPGEYILTAYAVRDGKDYKSNSVEVEVPAKTAALPVETEIDTDILDTTDEEQVKPPVSLVVEGGFPAFGIRQIRIMVDEADFVELYVLPKGSLVQKYLGSAYSVDDDVWTYRWDTRLTPNGEYTIFAYVQNEYGTYFEDFPLVKVFNQTVTTYTPDEQKQIQTLTAIAQEDAKIDDENTSEDSETASEGTETPVSAYTLLQRTPLEGQEFDELSDSDILAQFKQDIDEDLQLLATALRSNDQDAIARAKDRLLQLKTQIQNAGIGDDEEGKLVDLLNKYIDEAIARTQENVERIEKIIIERTQEQSVQDSDNDGVSNYDEVNFYQTNPFEADTDKDGYTDGSEILGGFDPLNPESESVITYESPKESGVLREDLFAVHDVITAQKNEGENESVPAALITGKALPNSFVTLYIFSTPVVVTVKTDAEGAWSYRFDKELEDGEHEVYVGVTDNSGKLVAKSSPFTFIKEAEAFSGVASTAAVPQTLADARSATSQNMVYLVLAISVVSIGLVLILLGFYLERRQRKMHFIQDDGVTV